MDDIALSILRLLLPVLSHAGQLRPCASLMLRWAKAGKSDSMCHQQHLVRRTNQLSARRSFMELLVPLIHQLSVL
jgi:hypothetical protein